MFGCLGFHFEPAFIPLTCCPFDELLAGWPDHLDLAVFGSSYFSACLIDGQSELRDICPFVGPWAVASQAPPAKSNVIVSERILIVRSGIPWSACLFAHLLLSSSACGEPACRLTL
jgi:hypothetical protein